MKNILADSIVIGTAGHIDHGKTEMIRALTGVDTDRLKEEKERGISIELGFAYFDLPSGIRAGIVDVPGHEKFIKNMLAGASGMDIVLLVVAADEGVMPQTREHMDILQLLGVSTGMAVITKVDMVDEEWLELVKDDVEEFLKGTFLEGKPVIPISSIQRTGMDILVNELDKIGCQTPSRTAEGVFRLPIDRFFTITGFGTVVTGTVWNGKLKVGDIVEILPGKESCRIRNLQHHNSNVGEICAGQRAAIALQGISKNEFKRGYLLAAKDSFSPSYLTDARLDVLKNSPYPIKNRMRVRFYLGTKEVMGRVVLLDREELAPGEDGLVQFRLEEPIVSVKGDRFVIRLYSPLITLGGGMVIDPDPSKHKRFKPEVLDLLRMEERGDPLEILQARLEAAGGDGITIEALEKNPNFSSLFPLDAKAMGLMEMKGRVFSIKTAVAIEEKILHLVKRYHVEHRLSPGISKEELKSRISREIPGPLFAIVLNRLVAGKGIKFVKERVADSLFRIDFTPSEEKIKERIEELFRKGLFSPPRLENVLEDLDCGEDGEKVFNALRDLSILVKVSENIVFHSECFEEIIRVTKQFLEKNGKMNVIQFKDLFGFSRKYAIPVIEYLDRINITRRVGHDRVLF